MRNLLAFLEKQFLSCPNEQPFENTVKWYNLVLPDLAIPRSDGCVIINSDEWAPYAGFWADDKLNRNMLNVSSF